MSNYPAKSQSVSGNLFVGSPGAVQARDNDAMRQLRRSVLFVANGSHPAKSPVGAAPSAAMPLLRSFVVCRSLSTKMPPRWGWERRPSPLTQGLRATAIEPSYGARVNVLPRPARNERGEGWGEGQSNKNAPPLPVPLLPLREERENASLSPPYWSGCDWGSCLCRACGRQVAHSRAPTVERGWRHCKELTETSS